MNNLILEDGSPQRKHRRHLTDLLMSTKGGLRIASAYVTDREFMIGPPDRERHLLISLSPMAVASGATSIETLGALIKSGVKCRSLSERPRLHAKVYIFGSSCAVITSANLTGSAFDSNIEVGVEVTADQANQLAVWFDLLWEKATPVTLDDLSELQKNTISLRNEFMKLKRKTKEKLQLPKNQKPDGFSDTIMDLFTNTKGYFVCNTDRRQGGRTKTGGYALEQEMFNRGFAAAWEDFRFPDHMKQVERGNAIFMFAKDVGIIGIGTAKGGYEKLLPGDPDRIHNVAEKDNDTIEWRVPVQWLMEWTDEAGAYEWKSIQRATFWNITDSKYEKFREDVKTHFIGSA